MKILELRFKNLNSLYGEWLVDFTAPEYESNGIFAITGPTGSGKSTIMDAICLALYGTTPRLGRITSSDNGIMSRKTGECYAEVVFESQVGRFRCHWSQHRARNKADGRLAEAEHELSDAWTGQILESKKRDVARAIEEKTGMDFDRFTRSILLAQGGFAAFLQAAPDERAPVLEQLTGTEIYSDISVAVHERRRAENDQLERLLAETSGIAVLTDEEVGTAAQDLARIQAEEATASARSRSVAEAVQWLEGIRRLREELAGLAVEGETAARDLEEFAPKRAMLARALQAVDLEGGYAALVSLRRQQTEERESLVTETGKRVAADTRVGEREPLHIAAEAALLEARKALAAAGPTLKSVRALDGQLAEKEKALSALRADLEKAVASVEAKRREGEALALERTDVEQAGVAVDAYLADHAADEALVTQFTALAEKLEGLKADAAAVTAKREAEERAVHAEKGLAAAEAECRKAFKAAVQAHAAAAAKTTEKQKELEVALAGRLLREYRADHEAAVRESAFLKQIQSLEKQRLHLEDGKPCPLCGALEHPYAAGNQPEADAAEARLKELKAKIERAETLEGEVRNLETLEKAEAAAEKTAESAAARAAFERETAAKEVGRLHKEILEAATEGANRSQGVRAMLHPFGVDEVSAETAEAVLADLRQRYEDWKGQTAKKTTQAQRVQALSAAVESLEAVLRTLQGAAEEKRRAVTAAEVALGDLRRGRAELYGAKDPEAEETRFERGVADAEAAEKTARGERDEAKTAQAEILTRLKTLEAGLSTRDPLLARAEDDFAKALAAAAFAEEAEFLSVRLAPEVRRELERRAMELDDRMAGVIARRKDRESRLAMEIAKDVSHEEPGLLKAEAEQLAEVLRRTAETVGGIRQRLSENEKAKEKLRGKQEQIEAARREAKRWDGLHALIGSADGKKYRNFAQGITFEMMVNHANRQLQKLTDRYLLKCDEVQPLEIDVVDNYQAGEIRSTKNLSGGESFIVSLSLALGLSKMASRKVRVDSLFLDEGFGTLDEEALETALETLAGLHQDGKLIGIISHVPTLKERIGTQIAVSRKAGGKSVVKGPGVSEIG
jgi:exonuclease SbcC